MGLNKPISDPDGFIILLDLNQLICVIWYQLTLLFFVISLIVFASADPLVQIALTMTSHTLSPEVTAETRRVFQAIDSTHSGYISVRDLGSATVCYQVTHSSTHFMT